MPKGLIEESIMYDIGDAIREKRSTTRTYLPSEMASAIRGISSGGSGGMQLPTLTNPGTANDLAQGKQLINADGSIVTGVVPNRGAVNATIDGLNTSSYTIQAGIHNGSGVVSLTDAIENALAAI